MWIKYKKHQNSKPTTKTLLQKFTTIEANTSAIPNVFSSMTAIEDKLKRIDKCMDLTQTRLSIVERIWLDNPVKDFKSALMP